MLIGSVAMEQSVPTIVGFQAQQPDPKLAGRVPACVSSNAEPHQWSTEESLMENIVNTVGSIGMDRALNMASGDPSKDRDQVTQSLLFSYHSTEAPMVQSLDPSGSGQVNLEEMSCFKLETKHKIFLSHAGAQKNFVEQLCVDLEARGYFFPFFDQRSYCLPKGKEFPSLIFEAAKQCHVAVIVLSEEFMTSKWPMMELAAFHEAQQEGNPQLNMLPLFFKLSMKDLDESSIEDRWMPKWREHARKDSTSRIDLDKWSAAVKSLLKTNGLLFNNFAKSEVSYRSAVTQAIFKLSPPDLLYGTSRSVVGCGRLCEILSSQFAEDTKTGTLMLGLYGMGGLGKTTMSRALCDHFQRDFLGRVCHVELGEASKALMRQKEVLGKLCSIGDYVLNRIKDTHSGWNLMQDCMKRRPVFLVIDNVTDEYSLGEARAYLAAGFHRKSRIMITSRSQEIVEELLSEPKFCKPMPDLTEEEAGTIFLKNAAPGTTLSQLKDEERRILGLCVEQCWFSRDGSIYCTSERQYHPLALQALGSYFFEISNKFPMSPWEKYLEDIDKLKLSLESSCIFYILGLQFSTFDQSKQLLFLDIALYGTEWMTESSSYFLLFEDWVTWLAGLHEETTTAVERKLRHLKRSGMINWSSDQKHILIRGITMHDLYREYAEWYVTEGEGSKSVWCVYQISPTNLSVPYKKLKRTPSANCWTDLMRIRIVGMKGVLSSKKIQEWCNVVLLQLHSCSDLRVLNLHGLHCLRHLELIDLKNLVTLTFVENNSTTSDDPVDTLESLLFVLFVGLDSLQHLPDFGSCTFLQAIVTKRCFNLAERPRIEQCTELKTLKLLGWHLSQGRLTNFPSLRSLRNLEISHLYHDGSSAGDVLNLEGLGCCNQLKILILRSSHVRRLSGLAELTSLATLNLEYTTSRENAPESSPLSLLSVLYNSGMKQSIKFGSIWSSLSRCEDVSSFRWEQFHLIRREVVNRPSSSIGYNDKLTTGPQNREVYPDQYSGNYRVRALEDETCIAEVLVNELEQTRDYLLKVYAIKTDHEGVPYVAEVMVSESEEEDMEGLDVVVHRGWREKRVHYLLKVYTIKIDHKGVSYVEVLMDRERSESGTHNELRESVIFYSTLEYRSACSTIHHRMPEWQMW